MKLHECCERDESARSEHGGERRDRRQNGQPAPDKRQGDDEPRTRRRATRGSAPAGRILSIVFHGREQCRSLRSG